MGNDNPVSILLQWLEEARIKEPIPEACSLATCDRSNDPHVRMVLARLVDQELGKITFFTNLGSPKALQLEANPRAALCFYWKSIRRQVRAKGITSPAPQELSDDYFASRPRASQVTAWASNQSKKVEQGKDLKKEVAAFEKRFAGMDVPRPQDWGGITVALDEVELWQERQGRRHIRTLFTKVEGGWKSERLYP